MFARETLYIAASAHKWDSEPLRHPPHKAFIRIAAPASEVMIEVSNHQFPIVLFREAMEEMEQDRGIQAPRDGHENLLPRTKEPSVLDGLFDQMNEVTQ